MNKVILIGGFSEIIELAESNAIDIEGIIDRDGQGYVRNYKILCDDEHAPKLGMDLRSIPLIITPDQPKTRNTLYWYYHGHGFKFASLISNRSNISKTSLIKEGSIIQYGVNISADVIIGRFVKLNTLCNIMHNSIIGDFTTIGPNAVVLGNVTIGDCCYIGSNSTILPNLSICDHTIVGAGAIVTHNITESGTYVGNPAKTIIRGAQ